MAEFSAAESRSAGTPRLNQLRACGSSEGEIKLMTFWVGGRGENRLFACLKKPPMSMKAHP
jgi:hypothetical protein